MELRETMSPAAGPAPALAAPVSRVRRARVSVAERRARLVVQCACELLGIDAAQAPAEVQLPLSVAEFERELQRRYAVRHPELVYRTDSTLERARLERTVLPWIPRVMLRRGAPPR